MTPQLTTLDNGLRVVSQTMPHLGTVSLGAWVGVGARDEHVAQHGICHLLEHMAFKGTKRRSARQIVEEVEMVGGDLNAATCLEMTAYYVRVLKPDTELALDVLADILQNSIFTDNDLTLEKDVVLQEIAGIQDSPDEVAYDLVQEIAYPGQSVGRTVIGTPQSVTAISRQDLEDHLRRRYTASNMVLSAAGAIHHDDLVRHARALFGELPAGELVTGEGARFMGGAAASGREFEQAHLIVGFDSPSYVAEDFYRAQVFCGLLGGGMSSRLFQKAREERGLCYSIYASAWGLKDGGMFSVHAATGQTMVEDLAGLVADEIADCASGGVTEAELARSKAQIKAGLLMSLESSGARAEQMARQLLGIGRLMSPDELIARIEAETVDSVAEFAANLKKCRHPAVAVVGAGSRSDDVAQRVRERFAA
ncbi:MAG: insulinase family protein [Hyphomicrobiaceae bacterium]|nr:insulinase family protein [Hyphomicrobiaceae bacterium]